MDHLTRQCRDILEAHYGVQFVRLVLYGSTARKEDIAQSDIDLLVLLRDPFDYFKELRTITDLLYSVQLDSDRLISAKPAMLSDFERGSLQLYRNIQREGVAV